MHAHSNEKKAGVAFISDIVDFKIQNKMNL